MIDALLATLERTANKNANLQIVINANATNVQDYVRNVRLVNLVINLTVLVQLVARNHAINARDTVQVVLMGSTEDSAKNYCGEGCKTCSQLSGSCTVCKDGFWGSKCTEHCASTCPSSLCQKYDGHCKLSCPDNRYGDFCEKECRVKNCRTCKSNDEDTCVICKVGFYGAKCSACPSTCVGQCNNDGTCKECALSEDGARNAKKDATTGAKEHA